MSERLQSDPATIRAALGWECTVRDERAAMDDDTFWAHVLGATDLYDADFDVPISNQGEPCTECGETGACGYDAEGRAMVHVTIDDDAPEDGDDDE